MWIGKPYWGQGYSTEAVAEIIRYDFEDRKLHRVYAHHLTRNAASGRVMQKAGMVHEGRLVQHLLRGGVFEDLELYGVVRTTD
ncbi:MAG: GNAT family protein [Gemmatimonadota bacterium]